MLYENGSEVRFITSSIIHYWSILLALGGQSVQNASVTGALSSVGSDGTDDVQDGGKDVSLNGMALANVSMCILCRCRQTEGPKDEVAYVWSKLTIVTTLNQKATVNS